MQVNLDELHYVYDDLYPTYNHAFTDILEAEGCRAELQADRDRLSAAHHWHNPSPYLIGTFRCVMAARAKNPPPPRQVR
jgi:hypothetical protein